MKPIQHSEPDAGLCDGLIEHATILMTERGAAVAYELLGAAMECARSLQDVGRLAKIEQLAETCQNLLDTRYPTHELSSLSAARRGTPRTLREPVAHGEVLQVPRREQVCSATDQGCYPPAGTRVTRRELILQ
jgi:hypothetical protein